MMSANFSLTCSDLGLVSLLEALLVGGREGFFSSTNNACDAGVPLMILCFLGENTRLSRATQFGSSQSLANALAASSGAYLDWNATSQQCRELLFNAMRCTRVASIDQLVDFIESLRMLFSNAENFQPNGLCAPTCVTRESPIGVFLRTFLTRWDCMPFDAVCSIFESLRDFQSRLDTPSGRRNSSGTAFDLMHAERRAQTLLFDIGTKEDVLTVQAAPSVFHGEHIEPDHEPLFHLVNAQVATIIQDTHAAENAIHKYYDSGIGLPGPVSTAGVGGHIVRGYGAGSNTLAHGAKALPSAAMEALIGSITEPAFSNARHQQAMLALASAWAQGGHSLLAMSAIEEAMKTAHARGDHAAVAKALLLLHMVVDGVEGSAVGVDISAEEVLARCIERCATLRLRSLAAHAALLMVRHRGRKLQDAFETGVNAEGLSTHSRARVHNIWSLWSSALLGDAKFSARMYAERSSGHAPPLAPTVKDTSSTFDVPFSTGEAAAFLGSSALAAVDLWSHLGLSELGELQARRAVRQLGVHATTPELVALCCKAAYLQIDIACRSGNVARLKLACRHSAQIVAQIGELFPTPAPAQREALTAAHLYCVTMLALAEESWDRAQRLARRLADASGLLDGQVGLQGVLTVEQSKAKALLQRFSSERSSDVYRVVAMG